MEKHVGQEPPSLASPVRVVDQMRADQPVLLSILVDHAKSVWSIDAETILNSWVILHGLEPND